MTHAGNHEKAVVILRGVVGVGGHVLIDLAVPVDALQSTDVLVVPAYVGDQLASAFHERTDIGIVRLEVQMMSLSSNQTNCRISSPNPRFRS